MFDSRPAGVAGDDPAGGQAGGGGLQCGVWDPGRQLAGTDDHWLLADHQSYNHHWNYSGCSYVLDIGEIRL